MDHEYALDYLQHLLHNESLFAKNYPITFAAATLDSLQYKMHRILIGWLAEVTVEYCLNWETLHLAVYFSDRHWSKNIGKFVKSKFQLIGITSLFVAGKFEEVYAPLASDMVVITDNSYTQEEIFKMELVLLKENDYRFGRPTVLNFVNFWSSFYELNASVAAWARHYAHLSLFLIERYTVPISTIAQTCIALSAQLHRCYSPFTIHQHMADLIEKAGTELSETELEVWIKGKLLPPRPLFLDNEENTETLSTNSSMDSITVGNV